MDWNPIYDRSVWESQWSLGRSLAPDDDVIVQGHAEKPSRFGDALCDLNIGTAWFRTARGMIVHEDQRACADSGDFPEHHGAGSQQPAGRSGKN